MGYDDWKARAPEAHKEAYWQWLSEDYEDTRFPVRMWEASNSRLGYLEWLDAQIDMHDDHHEECKADAERTGEPDDD